MSQGSSSLHWCRDRITPNPLLVNFEAAGNALIIFERFLPKGKYSGSTPQPLAPKTSWNRHAATNTSVLSSSQNAGFPNFGKGYKNA